jgi:acyl-CoA synthetase
MTTSAATVGDDVINADDAMKTDTNNDFAAAVGNSGGKVIFGCHDGMLRCASLHDGSLLWETDLGSVIFSSPIYMPIRDLVIVANTAGDVLAVDHCTGRVLAKTKLAGEVYSSPVVVNEVVFVGCRDDRLHAIRINKKTLY